VTNQSFTINLPETKQNFPFFLSSTQSPNDKKIKTGLLGPVSLFAPCRPSDRITDDDSSLPDSQRNI
jgi:hypothetical protein